MNKKSILILFLIFSSTLVISASARPVQNINCFSRYTFSDAYLNNFFVDKKSYSPGDTVRALYKLTNVNNYPIPSLNVKAYVMYVGDSFVDRPEGNDLVDEVWVARDVNLLANRTANLAFFWKVPQNLKSGTYMVSLYLTQNDQMNLAGLTFYPELAGKTTIFEVKDSDEGLLRFDKNKVFYGNQTYKFRSILSPVELPLEISATLTNEGSSSTVKVEKKLYAWDDLSEKNLVDQSTETITLAKGQSKEIKYAIKNVEADVYQLVLIATSQDGRKSIEKVRFPMTIEKGRFIFLGIDKFPIKKGDDIQLFWCYSNTASPSFTGSQSIEIRDENDKTLLSLNYDNVTFIGPVLGATDSFTSNNNLDKLKLVGKSFGANGELTDSVELIYDKAKFGIEEKGFPLVFVGIAILIIVILTAVVFISRRK